MRFIFFTYKFPNPFTWSFEYFFFLCEELLFCLYSYKLSFNLIRMRINLVTKVDSSTYHMEDKTTMIEIMLNNSCAWRKVPTYRRERWALPNRPFTNCARTKEQRGLVCDFLRTNKEKGKFVLSTSTLFFCSKVT